MSAQLWELLLKIEKFEPDQTLTCMECFSIIELLVVGVELGIEIERLEQLLRKHLAHCPGCQEQITERLKELEDVLQIE